MLLLGLVAVHALRRMDYLNPATLDHIRMTDASRSAYVAKNIADGLGYTTNDLPDSLIDFYDQRGKLHQAHWENADRFPFTAYATAALYIVLHSTSPIVGILVYNLLCFIATLALLYFLGRKLWGQRWSALIAVVLALMHPYTYIYLYLKDSDMLLLTVGMMWALLAYFEAPPQGMSKRLAVVLGTLLAWLFLARPNVGAPFVLCFGVVALRRWFRHGREVGFGPATRAVLPREVLALAVSALWLVPFVIYSLKTWGSPLFSANNLYQLPLGTRYGMGTDTWWKYTEPGHPITLHTILNGDRAHLISKFTSSWVATIQSIIVSFAVEIMLAVGTIAWLRRRRPGITGPSAEHRPLLAVGLVIGLVGLINLAVLPLYGYQSYAYRHYLGFLYPLMWLLAGHAVYLVVQRAWPQLEELVRYVRAHPGRFVAIAIIVFLAVNLGGKLGATGNRLFSRLAWFFAVHWVASLILIGLIVFRKWIFRAPWYPRAALAGFSLVYACVRPDTGIKRANLIWFPTDHRVWTELSKRHGIVATLALQGEVAWNTGRQNVPVPEWPMHLYSFAIDHHLEIQDVYIESADAMLSPKDGPFSWMAPGFEGYARLQDYPGHFPGYQLAFQSTAVRDYPRYRIKPHPKASTVYTLVDPAAIQAITRSPDHIDLGSVDDVIYTAHGWGRYLEYDGKPVVVATDTTRSRYPAGDDQIPWEDTSITFFLDDRRPSSVELEFYAPRATTYDFYWNLDLYAFDLPEDRPHHQIGELAVTQPGWQHVTLAVPAALTRRGLNKLGFKVTGFQPIVFCPPDESDVACLQEVPPDPTASDPSARVIHSSSVTSAERVRASLFATTLDFHY